MGCFRGPAVALKNTGQTHAVGEEVTAKGLTYKYQMVMKKIYLLGLIGMLMLISDALMAADRIAMPSTASYLPVWVNIRIVFKRPKFNCERGFGLCITFSAGIENQLAQTSSEEPGCPVKIQLNERNQLMIQVAESELTKYEGGASLIHFKGKSSITIEDPTPLPDGLCKALGTSPPLTIKPGDYPVSYNNGTYLVTFQL